MTKNNLYKRLGDYIETVNVRNRELKDIPLMGLSINKMFIPSIANTIGSNMANYKVIERNYFAYGPVTSRNGEKITIALFKDYDEALMSQAYTSFKITKPDELLSDYLMMWFSRPEFDRYARYHSHGSARETFDWDAMCDVELPVPSLEKQQKIVAEYQAVENKIKTNEAICENLEASAQALYKHWFVNFEFPNEEGKPYKSSGGKMVWNDELDKEIPDGWEVRKLNEISEIIMGQSPSGKSYNENQEGMIFYQGRTDFGFRIPEVRMYTTEPKRKAKVDDVLMSVRAPVGDLNISVEDCCIGRGLAAIRSKLNSYFFYVMKDFKLIFESEEGTGTIFSSINKDELESLPIIYNEENAKRFYKYVNKLDKLIINQSFQNQKLRQFQEILLSRMVKEK